MRATGYLLGGLLNSRLPISGKPAPLPPALFHAVKPVATSVLRAVPRPPRPTRRGDCRLAAPPRRARVAWAAGSGYSLQTLASAPPRSSGSSRMGVSLDFLRNALRSSPPQPAPPASLSRCEDASRGEALAARSEAPTVAHQTQVPPALAPLRAQPRFTVRRKIATPPHRTAPSLAEPSSAAPPPQHLARRPLPLAADPRPPPRP